MKRTAVLLLILCLALAMTTVPLASASAATTTYALITGERALLLREPVEPSISNNYFILPKTYFVTVLQADYSETLHKVRYRDLDGYVKKSDVEIKDYTPSSIYPQEVTLKINIDSDSVNLRARPDHLSSEVVYKVAGGTTHIEYYNATEGTDGLSDNVTTWYYVRIGLGSDSVVRGYLYASYVLLESVITLDNDTSAAIVPDVRPDGSDGTTVNGKSNNDPVRLVGIIALCIPAVAIVVIIFARPRKKKGERAEKYSS